MPSPIRTSSPLAMPFAALVACVLSACSSDRVPPDFQFGVAMAGFQVEMGCPTIPAEECEDRASDWYQYVTDPAFTSDAKLWIAGDPPSNGPGFYELYDADLARAKDELNLGSVRISIEWSRIFPTSTVGIEGYEALRAHASAKGVDFYHRVFAAMKARGLVPMVTLTHYTLPLWIHDPKECRIDLQSCPKRGWLDEATITEIAKYAEFVAREYGGEVDLWATQNEPLANVLAGYLTPGKDRSHPPALSLMTEEARTVTLNQIVGHARMYDAVKAGDTVDADGDGVAAEVGLVFNMTPVVPKDPDDPIDVQAAENIFYLYNRLYLNATIRGEFDANADGDADDPGEQRADLAGRMDYLGLNYYTRITVKGTSGPIVDGFSPLLTMNPDESLLWEDYPRGLYEMATFVRDTWALPVRITETGYGHTDFLGNQRPDGEQERLVIETLRWVEEAIAAGVDVRGIYWWTLMDNYEWNHGMHAFPLGLYAMDGNDPQKTRTLREIGRLYARIATARGVPDDLATKYPIDIGR